MNRGKVRLPRRVRRCPAAGRRPLTAVGVALLLALADILLNWPLAAAATVGAAPAEASVAATTCVPILMYHRIAPASQAGNDLPSLIVDPSVFAAQLRALHDAGWRTVTAARLGQVLIAGQALPPRTFVITLDDGYYDGYTYALPILERFGYRATFYVVAGRAQEGSPRSLTWDEIRALAAAGMDIGNHTVSHPSLPGLTLARVRREIEYAETLIHDHTGVRPATFAYPFGDSGSWVSRVVAAEGFEVAFTNYDTGCTRDLALRWEEPRLPVGPWTTPRALLAQVVAAAAGIPPVAPVEPSGPPPLPFCLRCAHAI